MTLLLFLSFAVDAQIIYLSTGVHSPTIKIDVMNEYYINLYSLEQGTKKIRESFAENSTGFNYLNIFYEQKITAHLSLTTGFYLHNKKGAWTSKWMEFRIRQGSWREHDFSYDFSYASSEFPLLLKYYPINDRKKINLSLSAGPYFGFNYNLKYGQSHFGDQTYIDKTDYGVNISSGIGLRKWHADFYYLKSFKNILYDHMIPENVLIKINSQTFGINVQRVIHLKKNSVPEI
jgi:hypothetical protein